MCLNIYFNLINLSGSYRCIGGFTEVEFKGFGYY